IRERRAPRGVRRPGACDCWLCTGATAMPGKPTCFLLYRQVFCRPGAIVAHSAGVLRSPRPAAVRTDARRVSGVSPTETKSGAPGREAPLFIFIRRQDSAAGIQVVVGIEPADVEGVVHQEAVYPAVLVRGEGELPRLAVIVFAARNSESAHGDSAVSEVDTVNSERARAAGAELGDLERGKFLQPREQRVIVALVATRDEESRITDVQELEREPKPRIARGGESRGRQLSDVTATGHG